MYSRQGAGYFYHILLRLFDEAGVTPQYVQHVTQIHSMLGLVRAGLAAGRTALLWRDTARACAARCAPFSLAIV
ncbi:type 2 periplasmic-binding domain-containing protein [Novosphingobium kunmingense]|uniref:hypothetical protein n=1 Tax=Novosphingobium kunmingense TaxID=1211806 RepID=UPI001E4D0DA6|nr:hypothetical protein [Novosphingobium kunmingense]